VGLLRGVAAFLGGVSWVVTTPRIWPRAIVPIATALVLVAALGVLGVHGAMTVTRRALGEGLGAEFVGVLLAITAVVLALVVGVALAQPLSGWALDAIVRTQEQELGIAPAAGPPFLAMMFASLASSLLGLTVGVPIIVLLTLAAWLFPPSAVVTIPVKVVIAALLLAWNLVDYPLASRGAGVGARLRWCGRNFGAFVGFGLAALLLFAVPGLGLIALPCGVAGAVRLVAAGREGGASGAGAATKGKSPRG
jgi:CysZ protein